MTFPLDQLIGTTAQAATAIARRRWKKSGNGVADQRAALAGLTQALSGTVNGRELGIEAGLGYQEFRQRVPARSYEGHAQLVERALAGEENVLWPGRCAYFAVSSGTTAGRTKYIPVTQDMILHFRRTGLDSLAHFAVRSGNHDVFAGRQLFLGGATVLSKVARKPGIPDAFYGDLSGITAMNLPRWAEQFLYEPGRDIAQIADWPQKIRAISERTLTRDIRLLAGIPSWILVLAEELRRQTAAQGRPAMTLRDIWPNLRCLVHGGVPVAPFERELRAALGEGVAFHEVYPASEGFIAAQDAEAGAGLRLLTGAGIFYEFIPLEDYEEGVTESLPATAVPLEEVETGKDYVIVMTTPAGLCRYVIGDVVRFTSTDVPRLVYAGRTKLQLSAFGEHVIEKELTDSLVTVAERHGLIVANFHVAPQFIDSASGITRGRHEWWIAVKGPLGVSSELLACELDLELSRRNDDYEAKRQGQGMRLPIVRFVEPLVFENWMRAHGKWGGQSKTPRCRSDRLVADELASIAGVRMAPDLGAVGVAL